MKENVDLEDVATHIILCYFQSWGHPLSVKIDALNQAVKAAGINATFVQEDLWTGWKADDPKEAQRAKEFRYELGKCWPIGEFEMEVRSVIGVIEKFKVARALKIQKKILKNY